MRDCICSSCKNLKSIIMDDSEEMEFECEFGFPSDECIDCNKDDCDISCENYEEDIEEEEPVVVECSRCGKQLKKIIRDSEEGEILCVDCFLKG